MFVLNMDYSQECTRSTFVAGPQGCQVGKGTGWFLHGCLRCFSLLCLMYSCFAHAHIRLVLVVGLLVCLCWRVFANTKVVAFGVAKLGVACQGAIPISTCVMPHALWMDLHGSVPGFPCRYVSSFCVVAAMLSCVCVVVVVAGWCSLVRGRWFGNEAKLDVNWTMVI